MNKLLLHSVMALNGHKQNDLANHLGIRPATLSRKINERDAEFSQSEIMSIKKLYSLTDKQLDDIFFSEKVSN